MEIEPISQESGFVAGQEEKQAFNLHEKIPAPPQPSTEGRGYALLQQIKSGASYAYSQVAPQEGSVQGPSAIEKATVMTEETLKQLLVGMLGYVIEGSSYESKDLAPVAIQNWIPSTKIESTYARRDRYLKEFLGSSDLAVEAAIQRSHGMSRKVASTAASYIPIVGTPTSYSITLWHQLREIALIAALYGHDLNDPQVKMKILGALLKGNALKAPAQSVDVIVKMIIEAALVEIGASSIPGVPIPTHLIFNYFTGNSAKVSTHAKEIFKPSN